MKTDPDLLRRLDHEHLWHPFTQQKTWTDASPLVIREAKGCWLVDTDGRRYLDGVGSLWTNVHGHRHPQIDRAIRAQLKAVAHTTLLGLSHPGAILLAKRLVDVVPWGLTRVFFSDDGSTAVEVALKMAFQANQQLGRVERTRFAALTDAYHGDTLGAVSVGGIDRFHALYRPLLFDAVRLPAPRTPGGAEERRCTDEAVRLLREHGSRLAGLVYEPLVQGAAGMKMHSPAYLRAVLGEARNQGVTLVADEVATGFGHTGTLFASEAVDVSPDLMCVAKGLSGGYLPLAATLATEEIYASFLAEPRENRQLFHGHTFTGNPLACAAALASLDVFEEEGVLARVGATAHHLAHLLETNLGPLRAVREIRQRGLMVGIDLQNGDGTELDPGLGTGHRVAMATREYGVITRPLGDTMVLNPPLAISADELKIVVDAVKRAIEAVLGG